MAVTKILKVFSYFLILIVVYQSSDAAQRYCGRSLPDVLDFICVNGFNSKVKKSLDFDDYGSTDADDDQFSSYPFAVSPFFNKIHGTSSEMLTKTRRRRHGIYDECCRKPCTNNELAAYCA